MNWRKEDSLFCLQGHNPRRTMLYRQVCGMDGQWETDMKGDQRPTREAGSFIWFPKNEKIWGEAHLTLVRVNQGYVSFQQLCLSRELYLKRVSLCSCNMGFYHFSVVRRLQIMTIEFQVRNHHIFSFLPAAQDLTVTWIPCIVRVLPDPEGGQQIRKNVQEAMSCTNCLEAGVGKDMRISSEFSRVCSIPIVQQVLPAFPQPETI